MSVNNVIIPELSLYFVVYVRSHVYTLLAAAQHQRLLHQTSLVSSPNERWRCLPRPPEEIQSHLILSRQHVLASRCVTSFNRSSTMLYSHITSHPHRSVKFVHETYTPTTTTPIIIIIMKNILKTTYTVFFFKCFYRFFISSCIAFQKFFFKEVIK